MKQQVTIYRESDRPFDVARMLDSVEEVGEGLLSTERAESSYGQPVLVYGGRVYTAWEAEALGWQLGCACQTELDRCEHMEAWKAITRPQGTASLEPR